MPRKLKDKLNKDAMHSRGVRSVYHLASITRASVNRRSSELVIDLPPEEATRKTFLLLREATDRLTQGIDQDALDRLRLDSRTRDF